MYEKAIIETLTPLTNLHPAYILRTIFLLAASTIIIINNIPYLRGRFLTYGPRSSTSPSVKNNINNQNQPPSSESMKRFAPSNKNDNNDNNNNSLITNFLDEISSWTVPHSYFEHFYLTSIFFSLYWIIQFLSATNNGRTHHKNLFSRVPEDVNTKSMSQEQVLITWILMTIQGSRRLYECRTLTKPSVARMWVVQWLLGIGFYIAMSMAVWIEGIPVLRQMKPSLDIFNLTPPTLRTFFSILIFIFASGIQYDCHVYLASLPKYTLPRYPAFANLICPHYTAECCIYLSLSLIAAPKGHIVNKTIFSALIFVVVNLGVTAQLSREWYIKKFGQESVNGKRRMIPLIY